jgi:hypothetical protein
VASNLQNWEKQAFEMRECKSLAELVARFGEPHHKEPQEGFEIWHYPLGAASGMLYSVHVSVWPNERHQAYLHMEPTNMADSPRRAWWQFWRTRN